MATGKPGEVDALRRALSRYEAGKSSPTTATSRTGTYWRGREGEVAGRSAERGLDSARRGVDRVQRDRPDDQDLAQASTLALRFGSRTCVTFASPHSRSSM